MINHSRPLSTGNDDGRTNANTTTATSSGGITEVLIHYDM